MTNMQEVLATEEAPHKLTLDNRRSLQASGVRDVESFDDAMVVLHTTMGVLILRGRELHLKMLSLDGGQVAVEGLVESLTYEEEKPTGGFWSRLWG